MDSDGLLELLQKGKVMEAIDAADDVEDKDDAALTITRFALTLYNIKGHQDITEALLKQSLILKYDLAETHFNLGILYSGPQKTDEDEKNIELAKKAYNNAIRIDPEYHEARFNLGLLELFTGDVDSARKLYDQIVASCGDIRRYRHLGSLLLERKRLDRPFPPDDNEPEKEMLD